MLRKALATLLVAASTAAAQELLPLAEPGARLRITIAGGQQRLIGDYGSRQGDAIDFAWRDKRGDLMRQRIPLRDINWVEVAQGRSRPVLKTALIGAAIGGAIGVAGGRMAGMPSCSGPDCLTVPQAMTVLGAGLAAVGGTIGAIRGTRGFEKWVPGTIAGWQARP